MMRVKMYSRASCGLCRQAELDLQSLQAHYPHTLDVIDIETDEALLKRYTFEIPVIEIGPYTLKAPISRQELEATLVAQTEREAYLQDKRQSGDGFVASSSTTWRRADGFTYWIARHYLALFNLLVFLYAGIPFLAPVLMKSGATAPAELIYRGYSLVCHQLGYRSFFLFGEQAVYPREQAGLSEYKTFAQATGLSEGNYSNELAAARAYTGELTHEHPVGYKVALCQRDVAIYGGILIFGLIFALTGRRWPVLHWMGWVFLGLVPVGLDGLSQLLSQPPLNLLPLRESTPAWRVLTGFLFGFTTAWFGYPMVEESMADARQWLSEKWQRLQPGAGKST